MIAHRPLNCCYLHNLPQSPPSQLHAVFVTSFLHRTPIFFAFAISFVGIRAPSARLRQIISPRVPRLYGDESRVSDVHRSDIIYDHHRPQEGFLSALLVGRSCSSLGYDHALVYSSSGYTKTAAEF